MKFRSFLSVFLFLMTSSLLAQSSFDWDKVRYGGRVGFGFSNSTSSIIIAPSAVYRLSDEFALGGSVSFGYSNFRTSNSKLYNYGASILSYYNPFRQLQLSAELEQTFANQTGVIKQNFNFLALYLGAGYRFGNITAGMRYDVLYEEEKNIYASPLSPFIQFSF